MAQLDTEATALVLCLNDLEAQTIAKIAVGQAKIVEIPGGWGTRVPLNNPALNPSVLPDTVILCELPDPTYESALRAAGKRVHVVDHHLSLAPGGMILDRLSPFSSLEQVAKLLGVTLGADHKAIAANDSAFWPGLIQHYKELNAQISDTQIQEIQKTENTVIQDRTIYEDAFIFAPNLHDMGLMPSRDFENYFDLFKLMTSQIQPPDLLIYLKADVSTLVSHIQKRGRDYEGSMSLDYLKSLNERYEKWISEYTEGKLLVIDANNIDFKNNPEDFGKIISQVDAELYGLF